MNDRSESLKELFVEISGDGTVVERQEDGRSYEPIDGDDNRSVVDSVEDGLGDAIDGSDASPGGGNTA